MVIQDSSSYLKTANSCLFFELIGGSFLTLLYLLQEENILVHQSMR